MNISWLIYSLAYFSGIIMVITLVLSGPSRMTDKTARLFATALALASLTFLVHTYQAGAGILAMALMIIIVLIAACVGFAVLLFFAALMAYSNNQKLHGFAENPK